MAQEKTWFDLLDTPEGRDILAEALRPRDAEQEALVQKTAAIDICQYMIDTPKYPDEVRQWAKEAKEQLLKLIGKRE